MAHSDTIAMIPKRLHCRPALPWDKLRATFVFCLLSTACSYESKQAEHGPSAGSDANGTTHIAPAQATATCATIARRPESQLPHGSVQGAAATTIKQRIEAIFAAQTPPIAPGHTYEFQQLACRSLDTPFSSGRYCSFEVQVDGADALKLSADAPAAFASDLFEALDAADIEACDDPHGTFFELVDATLTGESFAYTNTSIYEGYPRPNLTVHGIDAKNILAAFAAAGIDDCDQTNKVFLICGSEGGGAPQCEYLRLALDRVGSAVLLDTCGPHGGTTRGGDLTPEAARAVWNAILAAAKNAAFSGGPVEGTTIINANWFSWNGRDLGMNLVLSDAVPPEFPGPPSH